MESLRNTWALSGVLGLALVLVACGSDRTPARRSAAAAGAGVVSPGAAEDPDLGSAVSLSPASTLFALKFKLATAPVVGQPCTVDLVIVPSGNVAFDRLHLSLRAGDGLRLLSPESLDSTGVAAGDSIRYEVTVLPDVAGVLTLGATVVVDTESSSLTRTYTIPLIAVRTAG